MTQLPTCQKKVKIGPLREAGNERVSQSFFKNLKYLFRFSINLLICWTNCLIFLKICLFFEKAKYFWIVNFVGENYGGERGVEEMVQLCFRNRLGRIVRERFHQIGVISRNEFSFPIWCNESFVNDWITTESFTNKRFNSR